ncbi:hypothetical protein EX30DRAFT_363572 [Ascodesmis nigricans]|uniref:Uncharacterized protein n=1 Tax=Ascodesmis nigricans TaxID=341454 RepID=A0A4S2MZJ2_9PEZI|nr:hypothetical protein EX30DRAFT_363572 [Ascodesmis nigricans]
MKRVKVYIYDGKILLHPTNVLCIVVTTITDFANIFPQIPEAPPSKETANPSNVPTHLPITAQIQPQPQLVPHVSASYHPEKRILGFLQRIIIIILIIGLHRLSLLTPISSSPQALPVTVVPSTSPRSIDNLIGNLRPNTSPEPVSPPPRFPTHS